MDLGRRGVARCARGLAGWAGRPGCAPRPRPSSGRTCAAGLVQPPSVSPRRRRRPGPGGAAVLATRGVSCRRALPDPLRARRWCSPASCLLSPSSRSPPRTSSARSSCWPRSRSCPSSAHSSAWPPGIVPSEQWRAMESLSSHFLDVMTGSAHAGRAPAGAGPVAAVIGRGHRPLPPGDAGDPAAGLCLLRGAGAGRHPLRGPRRRHRRGSARRLEGSTCAPRSWCCSSRRRRTGPCVVSARSSTPLPRGSPPSRRSRALLDDRTPPTGGRRAPPGSGRTWCVDDLTVVRTPDAARAALAASAARGFPLAASPCVAGPSGCGKSTLLDVARRARAPDLRARHALGGHHQRGPPGSRRWRGSPSDRTSSHGTVADNLRLGRPDALPTTSSGSRCGGSPSRSGCEPCPVGSHAAVGEDGASALRR